MGWVGSAMGYYRLLGDVSTPISTNYPLTVYTEYTGIVIQTRTCRAVGYWSSLAPEYHVLPTSPSPAVTRPYISLLVLPRPESQPFPPSPTVRSSVQMPVARSKAGWYSISIECVDSTHSSVRCYFTGVSQVPAIDMINLLYFFLIFKKHLWLMLTDFIYIFRIDLFNKNFTASYS